MNTPKPVTFRMVENMPNVGRDRRFSTGFESMAVIPLGAFVIFDPAHPVTTAVSGRVYEQPARVRIVWAGGVTDVPREKAHQFMTESKWQKLDVARTSNEVLALQGFSTSYALDDLLQHLVNMGRLSLDDIGEGARSLIQKWENEEG